MYEYLASKHKKDFKTSDDTSVDSIKSGTSSQVSSCKRNEEIKTKIRKLGRVLENLKLKLAEEKQMLAKEKIIPEVHVYSTVKTAPEKRMRSYEEIYNKRQYLMNNNETNVLWNPINSESIKPESSLNFTEVYRNFINDNIERMYKEEYNSVKYHLNKIKKKSQVDFELEENNSNGGYYEKYKSRKKPPKTTGSTDSQRRKHHKRSSTSKSLQTESSEGSSFTDLPSTSGMKKPSTKTRSSALEEYRARLASLYRENNWDLSELDKMLLSK